MSCHMLSSAVKPIPKIYFVGFRSRCPRLLLAYVFDVVLVGVLSVTGAAPDAGGLEPRCARRAPGENEERAIRSGRIFDPAAVRSGRGRSRRAIRWGAPPRSRLRRVVSRDFRYRKRAHAERVP